MYHERREACALYSSSAGAEAAETIFGGAGLWPVTGGTAAAPAVSRWYASSVVSVGHSCPSTPPGAGVAPIAPLSVRDCPQASRVVVTSSAQAAGSNPRRNVISVLQPVGGLY